MKTEMKQIPEPKPFYELREGMEKGAAYLRANLSLIEGISEDDPEYKAAEKIALQMLVRSVLIPRTKWKNLHLAEQAKAERDQAALTAKDQATRRAWDKAGTNPLKLFPALGIGQVVGLGDNNNVTRVEPSKIAQLLGAGLAPNAALAMNQGWIVVSVPEADAHDLGQRYSLPTTLQWESGGRVCWCFSEDTHMRLAVQAGCVAGTKVRVAACRHGGCSELVYAPIEKAKFIVAPKDALPPDKGTLPGLPSKLVRLLNMAVGQHPMDVDIALLD